MVSGHALAVACAVAALQWAVAQPQPQLLSAVCVQQDAWSNRGASDGGPHTGVAIAGRDTLPKCEVRAGRAQADANAVPLGYSFWELTVLY